MAGWDISDKEIMDVEHLLLPHGGSFSEEARTVIRFWDSCEVSACPGSGKTTILLAKLKLLADRMPLDNGAGICVLSHTNVAVDQIKTRLAPYSNQIIGYPNFVGTIQSFVGKFITNPYLRKQTGRAVQPVDDETYARMFVPKMKKESNLYGFIEHKCSYSKVNNGKVSDSALGSYINSIYVNRNLGLSKRNGNKEIASKSTNSAKEFREVRDLLLFTDGIMRYSDSYLYALEAISTLSKVYTDLLCKRFQYVFVDEYQDCDEMQREIIADIFDSSLANVMYIGDPDQAIYNSFNSKESVWIPKPAALPVSCSNRYSQEIANVISNLRSAQDTIKAIAKPADQKPVLLVFDDNSRSKVVDEFLNILNERDLKDPNGIYNVIGAIKKEETSGLKLSSYWPEFDASSNKQSEFNYWPLIDNISEALEQGQLYSAEWSVRKILCRIFHYLGIKNPKNKSDFTVVTLKDFLQEHYFDTYRNWLLDLVSLKSSNKGEIDTHIRVLITALFKGKLDVEAMFCKLPEYFTDDKESNLFSNPNSKNIYIDDHNRRIQFDTIHGVKGETHDATLYVETDMGNSSDLKRISWYFGYKTKGKEDILNYSRRLAYVGFSRPRYLLCVAMRDSTYNRYKNKSGWEVRDIRSDKQSS